MSERLTNEDLDEIERNEEEGYLPTFAETRALLAEVRASRARASDPGEERLRAKLITLAEDWELKAAMEETRRPGDLTIPNCLRRRAEQVRAALASSSSAAAPGYHPKCATCHRPATCLGVYEDDTDPPRYGCDTCCGHGNEDGRCFRLPDTPAPAATGTGAGKEKEKEP